MSSPVVPEAFLVQRLQFWPTMSIAGPENELRAIAAWLRASGECDLPGLLRRMHSRLALLPLDAAASPSVPPALDLARFGTRRPERRDFMAAELERWMAEKHDAPQSERQSLEQWLERMHGRDRAAVQMMLRIRMTLLEMAAYDLHGLGAEAEEAADIFKHRPDLRVR